MEPGPSAADDWHGPRPARCRGHLANRFWKKIYRVRQLAFADSAGRETRPTIPDGWWSRPSGGRDVIRVALPLMISTLSYSVMQFCDRVFLTWYSATSVAAAMPAAVMAWAMLSFPMGVGLYTSVFVAQYFGAEQNRRIGQVVWHGMILGTLFLPLFVAAILWPATVFQWAGHSTELTALEADYLGFISYGSIAQVYGAILAGFFIGQGRTSIVMAVDVLAAALNILLDWLLIFGVTWSHGPGIEPLGIRGTAIATSLALWIKVFVMLWMMLRRRERQRFSLLATGRIQFALLWRMLRFGSSSGWQMLIECLGIAVFSLMIGNLGEVPAAATTLAISVNMLVFVPVWGLSTAVSTLVGQQIGKARSDLAQRATWTALTIGLVYTGVFAVFYLTTPSWFLIGYEAAGPQVADIMRLVRRLLVFVAVYCLFDSIQIVFVGALKGAGDVRFVVLSSLVCSGLFVAAGMYGHVELENELDKLYWWWSSLAGWLLLLTVVYSFRFLQGKWKTMQVIEAGLIGGHEETGVEPSG